MDALDDEYYDDCIRWSSDGLSLEIISPGTTERKLLKEVFNGEKLHSFIRKVSSDNTKKPRLKLLHQFSK